MRDKRKENERKIWDLGAKNYDKNVRKFEKAYKLSVDKILEQVNTKSNVLEIGCGTGIITFEIARFVHQIEGIDLSEKMLQMAKNKQKRKGGENINFRACQVVCVKSEKLS